MSFMTTINKESSINNDEIYKANQRLATLQKELADAIKNNQPYSVVTDIVDAIESVKREILRLEAGKKC